MTGAQLNTLINWYCRTNDTTFPQADKLVLVNLFKDEIAGKIVDKNVGYFLVPSTFDLVADRREYAIGDDLLNRIQKVEIKFSSTTSRFPSRFIKDYFGSETESEIVKNYSNVEGEFAHTIRRRALFVLSGTISAVTGGGRIWAHIFPADLSALTGSTGLEVDPSTTSFGFPRQFHELLARAVTIAYKGRQPKPIPLNKKELLYEIELKSALDSLTPMDNQGEIIAEMPAAQDLWDDGFDL
ncbi:hypothetical protein HY469_05270 [Candidatus Roizmanbacteria bacterium]|nr:hypothetical protein [Candidatus Roizmanbacteria bacterium]